MTDRALTDQERYLTNKSHSHLLEPGPNDKYFGKGMGRMHYHTKTGYGLAPGQPQGHYHQIKEAN